jgi:predicted ATPase
VDRPTTRLLGRGAECEYLDAVLAGARNGESRVVVMRGEAGVG